MAAREKPPMLRGSVVVQRRRCGKAGCHCASGERLHESTVLSYSDGGRTRLLRLPPEEVGAVRAGAQSYRAAKAALEEAANAGLAALVARLDGRTGPRP